MSDVIQSKITHSKVFWGTLPKSNKDYWLPKLANNVKRDIKNQKELKAEGWKVLTIWECEIKDLQKLKRVISKFLDA